MNQRTLNVLVVIALILVTGVQMRTGDMFAKLAKGQKLSESDIATLRLKMNQVENMTDIWSGNTVGTQPSFIGKPEDAFSTSDHPLIKIQAFSQAIPEDVATDLTFGEVVLPDAIQSGFSIDLVGDPTHITITETGIYYVILDLNSVGYADSTIRQMWIYSSNTTLNSQYLALHTYLTPDNYQTTRQLSAIFYGAKGDKISAGFYHSRAPSIVVYAYLSMFMIRSTAHK